METTVKVTVFAKKLRIRLKTLSANRERAIEKYSKDYVTWKKDLKKWILENYIVQVDAITIKDTRDARSYRYSSSPGFDTSSFFLKAPKPPIYPSDKPIREIRRVLRHLGITGQQTVRVCTEDMSKYFEEEKEEDD